MIKNKILWSTRGDKMYTEDEKIGFSNAAESLKKYRRAELVDDNSGKSLLDKLYVDLLPGNVVLEKCMRDNTTFLVGRKGTGKSTIFLKLENEYRKRKQFLPCYVDVKTIYESSQAQAINQPYLEEFFDEENLNKYLISRNFIRSILKGIYEEIDKQRQSILGRVANKVRGNGNELIKKQISELLYKIEDNEKLKDVEIPILQQRKNKLNKESRNQEECVENSSANINANIKKIDAGVKNEFKYGDINECKDGNETEYTNILLQVFEIKNIIDEIKSILKKMGITKLVIMLDDVSEIEETAIKLFIDTVVAPLNNWSEEFVKFKVAFYPSRVHYGKIDPGKIDIINLDFYNLYSEFDTNKMEENAIDFTRRLLENRFQYYVGSMDQFFDDKMTMTDVYTMFFRTSMNVPRIMGYSLAYLYQSVIIYGKKITKQDIENASEKYYEDNIDAFFRSSTYCLLSIEEKRNIAQLQEELDDFINNDQHVYGDGRYRISCSRFLYYLQKRAITSISQLNYELLLDFHADDYHRSSKSKDVYEDQIRVFLRYCSSKGLCSDGLAIALNKLMMGNAKVELISDSLGHSTDSTVHKYLSLDDERMRLCPLSLEETGISWKGGAFHA